jgi:hypothetical protein
VIGVGVIESLVQVVEVVVDASESLLESDDGEVGRVLLDGVNVPAIPSPFTKKLYRPLRFTPPASWIFSSVVYEKLALLSTREVSVAY